MSNNRGPNPPLNTFIVRFWQEPGANKPRWRGQVRHVQSSERVAFTSEDALLRFLRQWVGMEKTPVDK